MMQTHLRVGDRPRFNDGEGSTGGSRCVVRPEKKAHRIGRPLRVAGRGALHYAMNSTQPTTPCGNPTGKGVPPAQQKNGYQSKIEARIRNDATTANNARRRTLRRSHLHAKPL